jgi:hypothetical protein
LIVGEQRAMRAQRIRTGFHRIGLAIAVTIGVPSVFALLMSVPVGMGWFPEDWYLSSDWPGWLIGGGSFLVLALLGYLAAWTLGWIIAGFAGDD